MTVRVGNITFSDWVSLPYKNGWTDTFIFQINALSGIPPFEYKPLLQRLVSHINIKRPGASLWIQVDTPGEWYLAEVKQSLRFGLKVPYVITHGGNPPSWIEFSQPPKLWHTPSPHPPILQESNLSVSEEELKCLQVLARIKKGNDQEIASLTGLSENLIHQHLYDLKKKKLVIVDQTLKSKPNQLFLFPLWRATRNGLAIALRSWGVPKGIEFSTRKEESSHLIGTKHRHISRRWVAWLKRAWPHAEIWTGWSEVRLPGMSVYPDGLAWGKIQGYETLFWLEVGDDHKKTEEIEKITNKRLNSARKICQRTSVRLVYTQVSPKWVQEIVKIALTPLTSDVAVIVASKSTYRTLPTIEWGKINS